MHAHVPATMAEDGPHVVLVHGIGVSGQSMIPAAEALAPHCRVYAPDLPGHGRSDTPPQILGVSGLADAVAAWMDAVGLGTAALLGNSVGCQIVADLAARHPDRVERAVLQGPTIDPAARGFVRQTARWVVNGLRERSTQHDVTFREWGRVGLARLARTAKKALDDRIEDKLPHVAAPTLVVRGSRDPIVPQRWAEEATALLPRGRLVVIPDVTHTLTHTSPEALAEVAVPFLRGEADPEPHGDRTQRAAP